MNPLPRGGTDCIQHWLLTQMNPLPRGGTVSKSDAHVGDSQYHLAVAGGSALLLRAQCGNRIDGGGAARGQEARQ